MLAPLDLRGLDLERVRGTVVAARALSREICELCGAPGDPVWPAGDRGGTRCAGCRCAGDEVLPRDDAWRRERDPERERRDPDAPRGSYRQYAVREDDPGFDAVMDAGLATTRTTSAGGSATASRAGGATSCGPRPARPCLAGAGGSAGW